MAVAVLLQRLLPDNEVNLKYTTVNGGSHYFNSVVCDDGEFEVDLTGDQFGEAPVQVGENLYRFSQPGDVRNQFPLPRARQAFLSRVDILESRVSVKSA